jgi:hypothetical protein
MADATGSARAHCRWELGYQLWYTTYRHRVFDAVGQSVVKFEVTRNSPFVGVAGADTYWATVTMKESGASSTEVAATNTAGVAFRITTAGNEYDGCNLQASGAGFALAAQKPLYFGAKVAINHATSTDLYLGLCNTETAIMKSSAHGLHASAANHIGFYKVDGGTATKYISEKSGSASSSSAGTMTTSAHIYEIYYDGKSSSAGVHFYVDGSLAGTVTTTAKIPTAAMRPSLCFRNGNAAARQCDVYWWRCIQIGH